MNTLKKVAVSLIVVFCLLCGCSSSASTQRTHSKVNGEPLTFTKNLELKCKSSFQTVNAQLDISLNEGSFTYELLDPTGEIRWEGEVSGKNKLSDMKVFDPIDGTWQLNAKAEDVTGEIEIVLQGTD